MGVWQAIMVGCHVVAPDTVVAEVIQKAREPGFDDVEIHIEADIESGRIE